MTQSERESLCDGCGRCCLNKLEEDLPAAELRKGVKARVYYTDVGCKLLDGQTCRCRDYENRSSKVDDCVRLTPEAIDDSKRDCRNTSPRLKMRRFC